MVTASLFQGADTLAVRGSLYSKSVAGQEPCEGWGYRSFEDFSTVAPTKESISSLYERVARTLGREPRTCRCLQRKTSFAKALVSISFDKQSLEAAERHGKYPSLSIIQPKTGEKYTPGLALSEPMVLAASRMHAMTRAMHLYSAFASRTADSNSFPWHERQNGGAGRQFCEAKG